MRCESCQIKDIELTIPKNDGLEYGIWDSGDLGAPYRLCTDCKNRLYQLALRPKELFNLVTIHGPFFYLHDDFYDYETGEATQPETPVVDAYKYPFPKFEEVKSNLNSLINYAFTQYITTEEVLQQLRTFDKEDVLNLIIEKVKHNSSISYKAYEIIAKVVGRQAEIWANSQWKNKEATQSITDYAELLSSCLSPYEAFEIIIKELDPLEGQAFNNASSALIFLNTAKTLDWLELQTHKMINFTTNFGQLAASSEFSWSRCKKWLDSGRPLSLVALDALNFCLLKNYRAQSLWIRNLKPRLTDQVDAQQIQYTLSEYLKKDSVPRTKNVIKSIIENLNQSE